MTHLVHFRVVSVLVGVLALALWSGIPQTQLAADETATQDSTATTEKTENDKSNGEKTEDNGKESADAKPEKAAKASKDDTAKSAEAASKKDEKSATAESKGKSSSSEKSAAKTPEKKSETPRREKVRMALLTLKEALPENSGQVGLFGEIGLDLREAINRLEKASKDKSISGVVLDIQNPSIGRGKVEELRAAINRFKKSGKKVFAMLETAMPADYLIACACDEIVMPETGVLMLPGIHLEATFYKGLLSKLGIEADFIHIGECKGAAEPLTNEKFSEPVRTNMNALVDAMYDDLVTTIVKDRPLSIAQVKEVIDTGLITAKRAKELGLIDRVAYSDVLRRELADKYHAESFVFVKNYGKKEVDTDFSGPMGFLKLMQAMMGGGDGSSERRGKKVAVIYALGPIMSGESESDLFGDQVMGATTIVEALREANKDKQVVAIVLRIDSPGGSALASDLIWRETQVIQKPIVASMGDVAASGGYYIAMGSDKIYAEPGTITGSIGVVGGKLAMRGLMDKVGVTTETIERGKNSGLFASSGKFTDSQREAVKNMMSDIYDQFTSKAAEGRNMPLDKLRELAEGRVYSGRQAKENGLVDELGTLHDAIAEAKKLAGLDADEDVRLKVLPEPMNVFESLFGDMDAEKEVALGKSLDAVSPEMAEIARRANRLRMIFDQPAAFVMPFDLEVR